MTKLHDVIEMGIMNLGFVVVPPITMRIEWTGDKEGAGNLEGTVGVTSHFTAPRDFVWAWVGTGWEAGFPNVTQRIDYRVYVTSGAPFSYSAAGGIDIEAGEEPPPPPPPPPVEPPKPPPPVPTEPVQPTNPLDLGGWIDYAVKWLMWKLQTMLAAINEYVIYALDAIWIALPEWFRNMFDAASKILQGIIKFMQNPQLLFKRWVQAWFARGSESVQDAVTQNVAMAVTEAIDGTGPQNEILNLIMERFGVSLETISGEITRFITEPTSQEGIPLRAETLWSWLTKGFAKLDSNAASTEAVSLGQFDAFSEIANRAIATMGWRDFAVDMRSKLYLLNVGRRWERWLNKQYLTGLPESVEVIRMRRLELIPQAEFEDVIAQTGGIDTRWAGLLYDSSLDPPTLDDFITFNLRNPSKAIPPEQYAAIANIDVKRYKEVFEERQYVDPSVTQARFMYEVGAIDEAFVRDIVRRNRLRTAPLPGQIMSDADAVTNYITGFQTRIWYRQELLALRASFMEGLATEVDLRTSAAKLLTNPKAIDAYVNAAKQRRMVKDKTFNILPLTTLEKIVEMGSGTAEYMDSQIDLMDYTDETKTILKDYLRKKIAAVLAKQEAAEE